MGEVYPFAGFVALLGRRPPRKTPIVCPVAVVKITVVRNMRTRDTRSVSARYPSLKQWTPQTHDYSGQAVDIYDSAVLLVDAAHIHVGDYLLLGGRRSPVKYRVRHVEYHGGRLAYWRVRLERLSQPSAGTVDTVAS